MTRRPFPIALPRGPKALDPKAWGTEVMALVRAPGEKPFDECGDYAVVRIEGELFQKHWCCITYDGIRECVAAALASDRPKVCLYADSPGGDFAGALELARELRAMAKAAGKPLSAFCLRALSAMYAIASAAETIVCTPSANIGSVGVWAPLCDTVAADRAQGLNIQIIASGARKVDRNPHVPISEGAVVSLQSQVDEMADMFFALVSEHRGFSRQHIASLEGVELLGRQAIQNKLADIQINSWEEWIGASASAPTSFAADTNKPIPILEAKAMAKAEDNKEEKKDGYMTSLARALEEEKDEEEKARLKRALRAYMNDPKKEEGEGEGEGKAKAGEEPEKKEHEAKASSFDAAAEIMKLRNELAAKDEKIERAQLLASRPDFDDKVKALVADLPIDKLRQAVKDFPRASRSSANAAALAMPSVIGQGQGDLNLPLPADQEAVMARAMGGGSASSQGLSLGYGDLDAARKHLESKKAKVA